MQKNEQKPLKPFLVCDVESFQWMNLICMGLTDGEKFWEFGISKAQYALTLKFSLPKTGVLKPYKRSLPVYQGEATKLAMNAFLETLLMDGKDKDIYAHFGGKFDFPVRAQSYFLFHRFQSREHDPPRLGPSLF